KNYNINTKCYNNFNLQLINEMNKTSSFDNINSERLTRVYELGYTHLNKYDDKEKIEKQFEKETARYSNFEMSQFQMDQPVCNPLSMSKMNIKDIRFLKNVGVFFIRSVKVLNKYIDSYEHIKHSNIFPFLFDSLCLSNINRNAQKVLEPNINNILLKYQFVDISNFINDLKLLYEKKLFYIDASKTKLKNIIIPTIQFLNNLQQLNYLHNSLKNDYLALTENCYIQIKSQISKREKKITEQQNVNHINKNDNINNKKNKKIIFHNFVKDKKNYIYKNANIYRFSLKQFNENYNLFNIYLNYNLFNKAYK
ncbi:conserved protein, unknown function, partial [Hepatocystis sp. ex Piliocolobus tephrosceles]